MVIQLSRIAQSRYNAQTIVSEKSKSDDSGEFFAVGVDIGGTGIKAAVVSGRGDLLESCRAPSPRTLSSVRDFVHSVKERAKVPVRGVGVGCKGIIDASSTRYDKRRAPARMDAFSSAWEDCGNAVARRGARSGIAARGEPVWFAARLGKALFTTAGDGTWSVESQRVVLLDLMPDPQGDRYRFEAEIRQEEGTEFGVVGLFFGCRELPPWPWRG